MPHTLSTRTGFRDATTDVEFNELSKKFTESEKVTAALIAEVCKFRDNVAALLNCQAEFGIILSEIYDPSMGEPSGEVTPRRTQTAPESVQAVDDFQAVMREIRDILLPEVDKLEYQVVAPLTEMQGMMKAIHKTIVKREHKLVDYDRHRISLKKLQDKKDRSLSDEKQIFKLESQLEVATADYEGLNNALKEELPGYFWLRTQLMEPISHTFYFLQLRIFGILLDRIDPLARSGYYDLTMDIVRGYEARKGDIAPTIESIEVLAKRSVGSPYTSKYGSEGASTPSSFGGSSASLDTKPQSPSTLPVAKPWQTASAVKPWQQAAAPPPQTAPKPWQAASAPTSPPAVTAPKPWQTPTVAPKSWQAPSRPAADASPPPYSSPKSLATTVSLAPSSGGSRNGPNIQLQVSPSVISAVAAGAAGAAIQASKPALAKKPPPPPVPKRLGVKMVVALYDYDAQQDGDLSFKKDDRIEIVERTDSTQDWWTGKVNGRQGVFPGNYVKEL